MAGSKAIKGEIVTTGQENPLGVASELPAQDDSADSTREKQKIRCLGGGDHHPARAPCVVLLLRLHRHRSEF